MVVSDIVRAKDIMERLENDAVAKWFTKNVSPGVLRRTVESAEKKGFELDSKTGLLIRKVFLEYITDNLKQTILDAIFLRPVDVHYHKDVDEAIYVANGHGLLITHPEANFPGFSGMLPGNSFYIKRGEQHTFRPHKNLSLEIRLVCSGVLDPAKEICITPFDKYIHWTEYDKKHK